MQAYKCLKQQHYTNGQQELVPIRSEDRYLIMQWRNEQIFHLRQNKPLTKAEQDHYFDQVIPAYFEADKPSNILFSYLHQGECIGYGALVHINWQDKNAEISFIINPELEKDFFEYHWVNYLGLLEQIAFGDLDLHKIFTYAFDIRPHLYPAVEKAGFTLECRLKEHCLFEGVYKDVVIHSKWNREC